MYAALAATARHQHGAFSLVQAERAGECARTIVRKVDAGDLLERHAEVFVPAAMPITLMTKCWAAYLALDEPCAVAAAAAAHAWGEMAGIAVPELPTLWVPYARDPVDLEDVNVLRTRMWRSLVVERRDELPVLSRRDTIRSLAPDLSVPAILRVIQDEAFHRRLDPIVLIGLRRRGWRGSTRLAEAVGRYFDNIDSGLEIRGNTLFERGGLPFDHRGVVLVHDSGLRAGPVDGYFKQGLAVQFDGAVHERDQNQSFVDAEVDAALEEMGVSVLRATSRQLDREDVYLDRVRRILDRLGALHPDGPPGVQIRVVERRAT